MKSIPCKTLPRRRRRHLLRILINTYYYFVKIAYYYLYYLCLIVSKPYYLHPALTKKSVSPLHKKSSKIIRREIPLFQIFQTPWVWNIMTKIFSWELCHFTFFKGKKPIISFFIEEQNLPSIFINIWVVGIFSENQNSLFRLNWNN